MHDYDELPLVQTNNIEIMESDTDWINSILIRALLFFVAFSSVIVALLHAPK